MYQRLYMSNWPLSRHPTSILTSHRVSNSYCHWLTDEKISSNFVMTKQNLADSMILPKIGGTKAWSSAVRKANWFQHQKII